MLVDEVLLQHERLVLVLHHEVVEAVDLVDQKRDLRALVLVVHVLAHASAQLLRLAHVDDLAGLVLPQVHARQRGHGVQLLLDALELGGERIVGGAIPALAHGAVERGPAAALALEALGGLGIGWFVGGPALEAARIGGFDAAVGNARYDIREEALHAASAIAHEAAASQDAAAVSLFYRLAFTGALMQIVHSRQYSKPSTRRLVAPHSANKCFT